MSKKKPKIIFADTTAVDALGPYVDDVLDAIRDVLRIGPVFVSDLSCVSDFVEHLDDSSHEKIMTQLTERLGVKVEILDRIYEVAKRIRDK